MRRQCAAYVVRRSHWARFDGGRSLFYRPITNRGTATWRQQHENAPPINRTWLYRRIKMDPKPTPEDPANPYFGPERMWNPIPSAAGVWHKKADEWGWPKRSPPHRGLRNSWDYFPYFFQKYFPDTTCRLLLDSVLDIETRNPIFLFPPDVSKQEIRNYLRNIYNIDNIESVETRNFPGVRSKNEIGTIKLSPSYKQAVVTLDAPVMIDKKLVKETTDTKV